MFLTWYESPQALEPVSSPSPEHSRIAMNSTIKPFTEDDIAQFLANTPGFFERHTELLASVYLTSPHGQRAVSLQERQAELLRDKIKLLERKLAELIRIGQENVAIANRLHRWTTALMSETDLDRLPQTLVSSMKTCFGVPLVGLKVWGVHPGWSHTEVASGVSDDARAFAESLVEPYCGPNPGLEVVQWLSDPTQASSLALLPLRQGDRVVGLLVLASPDANRFSPGMGNDFLVRIAQLASAALAPLLPDAVA